MQFPDAMKKVAGIGTLLFVIGASGFVAIAAEPVAEPAIVEENSTVDYQEIADIFKKYNGKHDYTVEEVKSLKRASLSQSKLSDNDFVKLAKLQNIILWNLGRCHNLTRASIPIIKGLTSARAIDLADTKLFNDYDEIVEAFKDYKNLEFLSVHLEGKEPTEKYKEFLKARPQLKALVGRYSQKVEGGYRLEHKEALHAASKRWLDTGLITQEEYKTQF
jgi:hypothetical protein